MRRWPRLAVALVLALGLLAALAAPASALPAGSLDPSFGQGGVTIADFGDDYPTCTFDHSLPSCHGGEEAVTDVIALADGKVLIQNGLGGAATVSRFGADGRLDLTFGHLGSTSTGTSTGPIGTDRYGAIYVPWLPLQTAAPGSAAITKLGPDGQVLTSWGVAGTVLYDRNLQWAVDTDGLVSFWSAGIEPDGDRAVHVTRLGGSGLPDLGYGTDGTATLLLPPTSPEGWNVDLEPSVHLGPQGEVVVLDRAYTFVGALFLERPVIGRLGPDGRPDLAFSPTGGVRFPAGPSWFPSMFQISGTSLLVRPDGSMLLGGSRHLPDGSALSVMRLDPAGNLDPTFGFGGIAVIDLTAATSTTSTTPEQLRWMGTDAFGREILVGELGLAGPSTDRTLVLRLAPDGFLDASFGLGGVTTLPAELDRGGTAFAAFPDGAVVVGGDARATDRRCGPPTASLGCSDLLLMKLRG